jgi:hypothetical protein
MFFTPSISDAVHALKLLDPIPRPYGDNAGDAINSASVYYYLSNEHQQVVDHVEQLVKAYTRTAHLTPNKRGLTALRNNDYAAYLDLDQYDPYRLVGYVESEKWILDISDSKSDEGSEY